VSVLSEVVHQIRLRMGLDMTAFGKLLGISQGQVSRYEAGRALPGPLPLGRLLHLAEGVEKNPILERLSDLLTNEGKRLTGAQALLALRRMNYSTQPLWGNLPPPPPKADSGVWNEFECLTPNLAELLRAVDELCTRRREIDSSLGRIVRLWLAHDADPRVFQCFSETVQYLEFLLATKLGKTSPGSETQETPVVDDSHLRRKRKLA
jgi:transcriptional regulator with XRE-family HTH domain